MHSINPQELKTLMGKYPVQVVDVRKDHEVAQGIIEGAIHVPMSLVNEWLDSQDRKSHWVFYCHIGVRSGQAGLFAEGLGFENVYNLAGGVVAWHQSDYKLIKL